MAILTKTQILSASDSDFCEVSVPEWGGEVRIRAMSLREKDTLDRLFKKEDLTDSEFMSHVLLVGVCDETGQPIFTSDDIPGLLDRNLSVVRRIVAAWRKLNGLLTEGADDQKAMEEAKADFQPGQQNG